MKFWKAEAIDKETNITTHFCVAAPKMYNAATIRRVLLKVHPEYLSIKFKRTKKPENWKSFEGTARRNFK